ncbi:MAG: hypothetical protein EOP69_00920 [Spirochaetia bacterium]|nr:MAG: hypothetical protein EOP69_00920 [Spirochaetia bacterium]
MVGYRLAARPALYDNAEALPQSIRETFDPLNHPTALATPEEQHRNFVFTSSCHGAIMDRGIRRGTMARPAPYTAEIDPLHLEADEAIAMAGGMRQAIKGLILRQRGLGAEWQASTSAG